VEQPVGPNAAGGSSKQASPTRHYRLVGLVAATCAATALLGFSGDTPAATGTERQALLQPGSPQADIARLLPNGSPLASFYRSRGFRPLWSGGTAALAIATMASAGDDGLDTAQFGIDRLKALAADPARRTELEIAVSQAFTDYVKALRTPSKGAEMV
jgi:murein L,D-transpeptidase YcbB/YkuD